MSPRIGHPVVALRAGLLLPLLLIVGCSISQDQEIDMGRRLHPQFEEKFGGLLPDQEVQQYVDGVGQSLVTYAGRPELPWQYRVVNSDQINAFALPGGYIYITKGLLNRLENEAQLAAILAHETGHVVERHSVQQIQRAQGAQFIPLLAGVFGGDTAGDVAAMVTQLSLMKYSRDQEEQADFRGMDYMVRGGYNPRGMVEAMQIMQEASRGRAPPEFLSTHPNPGNRIEYLNRRIEQRYAEASRSGIVGEQGFRENVGGSARQARERQ